MDCINHEGGRFKNGYGAKWRDGGMRYAHRLAYEEAHGPIPPGFDVMHSCDNKACVNPEHLSLGSRSSNNHDAFVRIGHEGRTTARERVRMQLMREAGFNKSEVAREFGYHPAVIWRWEKKGWKRQHCLDSMGGE
jgi:hypothetical protein